MRITAVELLSSVNLDLMLDVLLGLFNSKKY